MDGFAVAQGENQFFRQVESRGSVDYYLGDGNVAEGYIERITHGNKFFVERMDYLFRSFVAKPYNTSKPFLELLSLASVDGVGYMTGAPEFAIGTGLHIVFNGKIGGELIFTPHIPIDGVRIIIFENFYKEIMERYFPADTRDIRDFAGVNGVASSNSMLRLVFGQIRQSMELGIDSKIYYENKISELLFLIASRECPDDESNRRSRILSREDMTAVNAAKKIMDDRIGDSPKIAELAALTNTSAAKLQNDFQIAFGSTLHGYVKKARLKAALQKIDDSDEPLYEIAKSVGCKNPGRLSELFRQEFGVTPSEYRNAKNSLAPFWWRCRN
jgi:AraC-like DNA-binding protein